MNLSPMRYKDYTWPHNPTVYEIHYEHSVKSHKLPLGSYALQSMGLKNRVLSGTGEFSGKGAYDEFRKLASVFYDETPGTLVHPVWQTARAYFVALSLLQEPCEDYVRYSFEFWECADDEYEALIRQQSSQSDTPRPQVNISAQELSYTVRSGDTLWRIANNYGLSTAELLVLNPQIKNPNLIHAGDIIKLG